MDLENLNALIRSLIFLASIPAVIFSFGVVWRVEKKLDLAFKFFLGSIIFFFFSELLLTFSETFSSGREDQYRTLAVFLELIFSILFLLGMIEMRSLIKKIEEEVDKNSRKK